MSFEWKDSYKIGNAELDAQHQHFFQLAQLFLEAQGKIALTHCAMELYKHTRVHFNYEEKLMRRLNYSGMQAHVDWHNAMIGRLNAISVSIQQDTLNPADLLEVIKDWALNHIPIHDAAFVDYMENRSGTN